MTVLNFGGKLIALDWNKIDILRLKFNIFGLFLKSTSYVKLHLLMETPKTQQESVLQNFLGSRKSLKNIVS